MTCSRRLLNVVGALAMGVLIVGCGGSSPSAPAPAPATPTKLIDVTGNLAMGNVTIGNTATGSFVIANSGNTVLTVTSIAASGGTGTAGLSADWTKGTVDPGRTQLVHVIFAPALAQFYSAVVRVIGDQTNGNNAINFSGTGISATPPPAPTPTPPPTPPLGGQVKTDN